MAMLTIEAFKSKVRWEGWAQGKLPWLCSIMFFLILKSGDFSSSSVWTFIFFMFFTVLCSVYGYLVNDLFDIEIDRAHGKTNVFEKIGFGRGVVAVAFVLALSLLLAQKFMTKSCFLLFWAIWIFLATFYSAKPLRFKERGVVGLFCAFVSQYPLPVLLCFCVFDAGSSLDVWPITLLAALSGAALEIGHQRYDLDRDRKTDTRTFGVASGKERMDRLYRRFLVVDSLSVLFIMLTMSVSYGIGRPFAAAGVFLLPVAVYGVLNAIAIPQLIKAKTSVPDPYYVTGRQDILNITYTLFPSFFLPFYLGLVLVVHSLAMSPLLLVFILITYVNFPRANFLWPVLAVFKEAANLGRNMLNR